jgi:WD40-like Beta Propeller Repeat
MDKENQLAGDLKTRVRVGKRDKSRSILSALLISAVLGSLLALVAGACSAVAAVCPNEQLRVETNSLGLPECRAYELVSPPVKDFPVGAPISGDVAIAAAGGGKIVYNTSGPLPGSVSGTLEDYYLSNRTATGWQTTPISPPSNPRAGATNLPTTIGFAGDLSMVFLLDNPSLAPGAPEGLINAYVRDGQTGSYSLVAAEQGNGLGAFLAYGGGANASQLIFEAYEEHIPGATHGPNSQDLYELTEGQLRDVGILPDGSLAPSAQLGAAPSNYGRVTNAISADGRRIIFTASTAEGFPQVFDRIDHTTTIEISASQRTTSDTNLVAPPAFWGASTDGGTVFFTDPSELTDDANTGEDGSGNSTDAGRDLYSYDLGTETLTDLTVDTNPADAETGANVQGVIGNSDDGEYVYFVATGKLATGATSGALNLYLEHGGTITYIGGMDPADASAWGQSQSTQSGGLGVTARVSPSGRYLAIQSVARLTAYDNVNPGTGAQASEVYRYAADTGDLICVSCRTDGTPPSGNSFVHGAHFESSPTRALLDDGRVFFDSTDAIVPGDTNGKSDVYEWVDGAPHLISDGTSPFNSFFRDISADATDIFFSTETPLVGQDIDTHADIYDARAGGGFPAPPVIPPGCVAEACRTGTSAAPAGQTAATVGFQGPPNPKAPQPKKNKKKHTKKKAHKVCKPKSSTKCKAHGHKHSAKKSGRNK